MGKGKGKPMTGWTEATLDGPTGVSKACDECGRPLHNGMRVLVHEDADGEIDSVRCLYEEES
jgi:hypothetical protein